MDIYVALLLSNLMILTAFGGLLVAHIWFVRAGNRKDKEFMKAFMARTLSEFDTSERIESLSNAKHLSVPTEEEFVPLEQVNDDLFHKMIKKQLGE